MEYKCPCCGGKIEFQSATQQMQCPFCDTVFELEALQSYDDALKEEQTDDMTWDSTPDSTFQEGETEGMGIYTCQNCGGEIVADSSTAASKCPYCDNPIIMTKQFSGDLKPDFVIPFQLDKKAAKEALQHHLQGKHLLPKIFQIRIISTRSRASTFPSGCSMQMPISGIRQQKFAPGTIISIVT